MNTGISSQPEITRLAPSPTGALHLGNVRTFLVNWLQARQRGWRIILRIEDLDGPRTKPGADTMAIELLTWLGLDWDDGPVYQSADLEPYTQAMRTLARQRLVYPCNLTRAQIAIAASAPHDEGEVRFDPALRPAAIASAFDDPAQNWRFSAPADTVIFEDTFAGRQECIPAQEVGDFVVWTRRGEPSYQLAVVVDDHRQGVTQVVRGDDLIASTARQVQLYTALGQKPMPAWTHLPLVVGPDGKRLAKRHGDTRLDSYRKRGVCPQRVLGLCAHWLGMGDRRELNLEELLRGFDLSTMPRQRAVFTAEDDQWLLGG